MKQIPNLLTLLNLLLGCIAIIFATQSGIIPLYDNSGSPIYNEASVQFINIPEKITIASFLIIVAAIIDFFDGFVARLLKAGSEMGKQLDSLADVVSFGVAPSVILYQFLRLSYAQQENGLEISTIWLIPAFLLTCASAWRLARFNIDAEQQHSFRGLPVPASGLFVASFPLIYWFSDDAWQLNLVLNIWFLYGVIIILSLLMISRIKLLSFKMSGFNLKESFPLLLLIVVTVAAALLSGWIAIPIAVAAYIIVSLLFKKI